MTQTGTSDLFTALVLAGSRAGAADPVAAARGCSHKCLTPVDGTVMLERVVRTLVEAKHIGAIIISIENEALLRSVPYMRELLNAGRLIFSPAADNLYLSVKSAVGRTAAPYPLLITTGDNALHTPDMLNHFTSECRKKPADVAAAMTPSDVILATYPDGKRAFHRLQDGGWSSCNLYALMTGKGLVSARAFTGGGQFGKKPGRILKAFGLGFMIRYHFSLSTLDGLARHLSKRWSLTLRAVSMPFADAPIDVDTLEDLERTERILRSRKNQ